MISPVVGLSVAHGGNEPAVMLKIGAGEPVVVTGKEPTKPTPKATEFALVINSGCWTVSTPGVTEVTVLPIPLVTEARNWSPLMASVTFETVSVEEVMPL